MSIRARSIGGALVAFALTVSLVVIPNFAFANSPKTLPSVTLAAENVPTPRTQRASPAGTIQTDSFRVSWQQQTWLVPDSVLRPNLSYTYLGGLSSSCFPYISLALKSGSNTIADSRTIASKSSGTITSFSTYYHDLAESAGTGPYTLQMWVTCDYFDNNFERVNVSQTTSQTIYFDPGTNPGGVVSRVFVSHKVKGKHDLVRLDWHSPHALGFEDSDFKFRISNPNNQNLFGAETFWSAEDYWDIYVPRFKLKRKKKYFFQIATIHPIFGPGEWSTFWFRTR
jgi:hypothetical protein